MSDHAPVGVQLRRTRGWRMPLNCVKVDRSSKLFGNPFRVGIHGDAGQCVEKFEACLRASIGNRWALLPENLRVEVKHLVYRKTDVCAYFQIMAASLQSLRGKNLGCWCPPNGPCHRNVLLRCANITEA